MLAACGDDDGVPRVEDTGVRPADVGPSDSGTSEDASESRDSDVTAMDAGHDAEPAMDSGTSDAMPDDAGTTMSDAAQPVDPVEGLVGVWEVTGLEDSGGAHEDVPPGNFVVFDGSRVRLSCADGMGLPYELRSVPGGFTAVHVDLGGSSVDWVIVELTATTFVFVEGGDRFFHERRDACP